MSAGSPDRKKKAIATLIPLLLGLGDLVLSGTRGINTAGLADVRHLCSNYCSNSDSTTALRGRYAGRALRSHFTGTLTEAKALSGFASGTVWLIFCAYILSLGFVTSGLGKRIAYKMLSLFGGSSLGLPTR
ncbi:Inner membrane protein ybhI [Serratia fonticola]|uniref:Inner membrane protein ybhI n=1 Tax=Serratia fonticola TaxID=47917 RepID=A0A4V6KX59_SERFO|nr:Inner membrane protein ybhI [Serratia fonticola]